MTYKIEEYPFCQLNETTNLSPDGKVLSKSLMINLRNQSPEVVYKNYRELKKLIEGKIEAKENKPEKKTENNPGKKEQQVKKDNPGICPKCGALLVEKQGISSKNGEPYHFFSCGSFPNCRYSKPFVSKAEKNEPSHEDLMAVYE